MKTLLFSLYILLAFANASAKETTLSSELQYIPHSTSFLAQGRGQLLKRSFFGIGQWGVHEEVFDAKISNEEINYSKTTPTIVRFDLIQQQLFNRPSIIPAVEAEIVRPFWKSALWEGFCDQRAQASLNSLTSQVAFETTGLKCGDIILSKGEIRELLTALIPQSSSQFFGDRTYSTKHRNNDLLNLLGVDDLRPEIMEKIVHKYLSQNKGVVFEMNSGVKVFNHAVFKAESYRTQITVKALLKSNHGLKIPLALMKPVSEEYDFLYNFFREFQSLAIEQVLFADPKSWVRNKISHQSSEYYGVDYPVWSQSVDEYFTKKFETEAQLKIQTMASQAQAFILRSSPLIEKMIKKIYLRDVSKKSSALWKFKKGDLLATYRVLAHFVLNPLIAKQMIVLKPRTNVIQTDMKVYYRDYATYNSDDPDEAKIKSKAYSFLIFEQSNFIRGSAWITPLKNRPDFMWIPNDDSLEEFYATYQAALGKVKSEKVKALTPELKNTLQLNQAFFDLMGMVNQCEPLTRVD